MKLYITVGLLLGVLTQYSVGSRLPNLRISENHVSTILSPNQAKPEFCRSLECPEYSLVSEKEGKYELRHYPYARWASTDIYGIDMEDAGSKAFYRLFDYISGENEDDVKIDMTAPVINHVIPGEGPICENNFTYSFFVPSKYQKDGPPEPTNTDVYLSSIEDHLAYVRQFPGRVSTAEEWVNEADILKEDLTADGLIDQVDPTFFYTAGYDSPFQIFHRHNEIWVFVLKSKMSNNMISDNKLRWVH